MPTQTPQPSPPATVLAVRQVIPVRPLHWLRLGWADFMRHPGPGLLHGLAVALGGWIVLAIGSRHWTLLAGAFSGFVLMGPILATGLYEISRLDALGRPSGLGEAVAAWRRGTRPLVSLGLMLGIAGTSWVAFSAILFHFLAPGRVASALDFLRYAAVGQSTLLFVLWTMMGGIGAALVFAVTAVSPPLLLARIVSLRTAILTSVRAVGENPVAMGVWATIIMAATFVSLLTFMLGFAITIPVIGHATWHAYEDLVDTTGVRER